MQTSNGGGPEARIERELQVLSDRLGGYANADHWFDQLIDSWRTHDGSRIPALELEGIGEMIPVWVSNGESQITASVLKELERFLSDGALDQVAAKGYAIEVLSATRDQLILDEVERMEPSSIRSQIESSMGVQTRQIWNALWAA
jgi:hypothetical protein